MDASESLEVLPFGLVRYRRRGDVYSRPSSLVTEKTDVLRLFRTPYPTGSERDMKIAVRRSSSGAPTHRANP